MTNNIKINFTTEVARALFYMKQEVVLDTDSAFKFRNMIAEMYTHDDNLDDVNFKPVLDVHEIIELALDCSNFIVMNEDEFFDYVKEELDTYHGIMSIGEFIDDNSYDEDDIMHRGYDIVDDYKDYLREEYFERTDDVFIEDNKVYVFHIHDIYSDIRNRVAKELTTNKENESIDLDDIDFLLSF